MADQPTLVSGVPRATRRLNPFAFPAETNVRFALMVVAALTFGFYLSLMLGFATDLLKPPGDISLPAPGEEPVQYDSESLLSTRTAIGQSLLLVCWPTGLVLLMLVIAALIYRTHPARIRRRKNLRALPRQQDPRFYEAVVALAELAGVNPVPAVEVSADSPSLDGQVFGFRSQPVLRLGGRLRLLLRKAPDAFRAIVLHELAHVANRDVQRTYFAQSLWVAVVVLTFIPTLVLIGYSFGWERLAGGGLTAEDWTRLLTLSLPTLIITLLQVGATLAVVAAARASLLRAREVYADWRAALWGAQGPLSEILGRSAQVSKVNIRLGLWRLHPTPHERLALLRDPARLFLLTPELAFLVGLLLAFVLNGFTLFGLGVILSLSAGTLDLLARLSNLALDSQSLLVALAAILVAVASSIVVLGLVLVLTFGAAYLAAGTVGLDVQRQVVAEMLSGRQGCAAYLRLWKPAALLAAGAALGFLFAPFSPLALLPDADGSRRVLVYLLLLVVWALAFMVLIWLWLAYARFFARRTLGRHTGGAPPRRARRWLTLALTFILTALSLPAILGQILITNLGSTAAPSQAVLRDPLFRPLGSSLVIAFVVYGAAFVATWLLVQVRRLVARPRCPNCQRVTARRFAVGQACEHCGSDLAPWLFAEIPPSVAVPPHKDETLVSSPTVSRV